jgi:hypothetical protein
MKIFFKAILLLTLLAAVFAQAETKEALQKDLEQGIQTIQSEVKDLQEKAKTATGQMQRDITKKIEELKSQEAEINEQAKKIKSSSGLAWQDLKNGAKKALENIKQSVKDAKERFKE